MSTKPAEAAAPKSGSKKMLVIILVVLLVLVLGGGGAFIFLSQKRAAAAMDDHEEEATPVVQHAAPKTPPAYLPLDNMVVNLADPGGEKVAQVGITFEVADAKALETVKQFMPSIRSGVLLMVSQRTSEELLQREGKEKLAADILAEAARPFGGRGEPVDPASRASLMYPVRRVLFSSFIVQ